MKVRTRFAPSPTGSLHLGGARTALFNWLFARKNNGSFILRIEDTDVARSTEESAKGIIDSLNWLGLNWDEGPYFQSSRINIYMDHLDQLRKKGIIYPAFESKEHLETMRQKAVAEKRNPIYDRSSLKLSPQEIQSRMDAGEHFVWRFKVAEEDITEIPELLMADGNFIVKNETIGDFVITRPGTFDQPGMPLYNFVCTIDDALMDITHVIRGVEHLPNTVKQVLLYKALDYDVPKFVHLPLIMKHGKKMSKRDQDAQRKFPVSILERRDLGYLPEATLNHLALLGWSSADGSEILSLDKLKKEFDLDRLSKANANFDEDKYLFLNSHYLKNIEDSKLVSMAMPFLVKAGIEASKLGMEVLKKLVAMEKNRCKILSEFADALSFFFDPPKVYDEKGVNKFFKNENIDAVKILETTVERIKSISSFDPASIDHALQKVMTELDIPFSKYGPVIRLALTGRTMSPSLVEMIDAFGKVETIERLEAARDWLQK